MGIFSKGTIACVLVFQQIFTVLKDRKSLGGSDMISSY